MTMKISDDTRVETLRNRCRERSPVRPHGDLARRDGTGHTLHPHHSPGRMISIYRSMLHTGELPWQRRMGLRERKILEDTRLEVDDLELLVGRLAPENFQASGPELEAAREFCENLPGRRNEPGYIPVGKNGHCQLYFDDLFRAGIDGLARRMGEETDRADAEGKEVLQSFLDALAGLKALVEHAAHTAARKAREDLPPWRQEELEAVAEACRRVASGPPRTFHEAIQLMWLTQLATMYAGGVVFVVPGRMDRHLKDFYRADLEAGRITAERALLMMESLYILINEYTPAGGAVSVMVGGGNAAGDDVTNELSYLSLEALRRTRLVHPIVGLCWHEGTPESLLDLAMELIAAGNPNPAIFGDEVIQKGLQRYGVPPAESHDYINSTCVEITPSGSSNVWVASPYFNTCALLLEEIAAAVGEEDPPRDFKAFLQGYLDRLSRAIGTAADHQNQMRRQRQQYGGKPLQSIFTKDCIHRRRDLDDGGARYNWVECSFVGLANLADSLYVIREEVFRRGAMTLGELKTMLDGNFQNHEREHARIQNKYPKYGHGNEDIDRLFGRVIDLMVEECARYRMEPDGSPFIPGAFAYTRHERFGRETGATPDGRPAGIPFADGCGPAQGREKFGPTAAILSTTSWDHAPMLGGLAFNMKFHAGLFKSPGKIRRLKELVLTYLRLGGFETQINVTSRDLLEKAKKNPREYRDLVVRIGGYTDYFTRLTPEMQDEIMLRTEFEY